MTEIIGGEARRPGRIEVVCGSMFSGKTEELIRRMRRAEFAKQKVEIFKPSIDTRYSDEDVVSHDQHAIPSTPIDSSASILLLTSDIDECDDDGQHTVLDMQLVLHEFHNRVQQVGQQPGNEERQQHIAEVVDNVQYGNGNQCSNEPPYERVESDGCLT